MTTARTIRAAGYTTEELERIPPSKALPERVILDELKRRDASASPAVDASCGDRRHTSTAGRA